MADIECYRLPIKGQIDVIIALKRMQNAAVLRVGALFPLNAETVSTVSLSIFLNGFSGFLFFGISAYEENLFISHVFDKFC